MPIIIFFKQCMAFFKCTSIYFLKTFTDAAKPAAAGKPFQSFMILCEK